MTCRRLCASAVLLTSCLSLAAADSDPLAEAEKGSELWLQTRIETARITSAWVGERALLESTLAALQERAATEEDKRALAEAKTAKERAELEALREKARTARDDLSALNTRLQTLQRRLLQLRPSLPPRLSAGLEMAFRTLENPELSPGERMQITTTILNRCVQFNHTLTCGEEVLALDGSAAPRAVQVIYWGLGHAYAVDRAAGRAWFGHPDGGTWTWQAHPEAAKAIARLIDIYTDKADPAFVTAPALVQHRDNVNPRR